MAIGNPNINDVAGGDIRNMFFHIMPNWLYSVNLIYNFNTVISITRRKLEQRKALINKPKRILTYSITENVKSTVILNYFIALKSRNLSTPLYTEPMIPRIDGSLQGLTVIRLNDITYYYNLRELSTFVVLIDRAKVLDVEILRLSPFVSATDPPNIIRTTTPVTQNFLGNTTVIYPLFNCYLTNKEFKDLSDTMTKIDLEFTEYF